MKIRIAALLTLIVALAGCAAPGKSTYSDHQNGLLRSATQTSTSALRHTQSVAVVFSENTKANQAYLEHYHSVAQNSQQLDEQVQQAYISSSEPSLAIDWFKTSLQAQFASVTFYDNLDSLMAARPDVIVMLDTRSTLVSAQSADVKASIVAEFFDAQLNYIGKAEGHADQSMASVWAQNKNAPEIAAVINQQHTVQVSALQQFDSSLDSLFNVKS
ncbi:ATPase [Pseudomonas sp. NA-150]|uniref:ATPase n=1 Tax=Pseudomonas sp. NA-150 TaxID=3367525 RepID=UPI0037C914F1